MSLFGKNESFRTENASNFTHKFCMTIYQDNSLKPYNSEPYQNIFLFFTNLFLLFLFDSHR